MAELSFYRSTLGLASEEEAFDYFVASLQTYYDAAYYVDWKKVWANRNRFSPEFHLLSSLCEAADVETATRELLRNYPRVVRALPSLLACRDAKTISVLEDVASAHVEVFDFVPRCQLCEADIERYARFIGVSGLLELLVNIKSVPDYVTGVEVGSDTNGRKNRSGALAVRALKPHIEATLARQSDIEFWPERDFTWLSQQGCALSPGLQGKKWDGAFLHRTTGKWVLMEVNHYGTSGSKPIAVAGEYVARERELMALGIGFLWVTDGLGWLKMTNDLRYTWRELQYLMTIQLARDGLLEHALIAMLGAK